MLKHSMKTIHLDRYKVLTGSAIKLIAVLAMLSGHITKFYFHHFTGVTVAWPTATWFTIAGRVISFHQLLLMFGKFAFPLFVFSLVEGFEKTHDRKKYGLRLLILAILSEIPFDLMISGTIYDPEHNNVIITLFMGFLALCGLEYFKKNRIISFLIVLGLFLASRYMNADYRSGGFLFILLIYGLRKEKILQCIISPVLLQMKTMVFLSLVLTMFYNGKRGFIKTPFLKYFFYAFYPLHMLVIYLLATYF